MSQFDFLFGSFQIKYGLYGIMVEPIFAVVSDLAGNKVGKNCRKDKNKINCAIVARFHLYDGIGFKKNLKFIMLNNS